MAKGKLGPILMGVAAMASCAYAVLWQWMVPGWLASPNELLFDGLSGLHNVRLDRGSVIFGILTAVGLIGATLYATVRVLLWRRARGGRGSALLLAAAILGSVPLLFQISYFVVHGLNVFPWGWQLERYLSMAGVSWSWIGWLVPPLAVLLLALGLMRSRLVPRWVAAIGVLAAILLALTTSQWAEGLSALGQLDIASDAGAYVTAIAAEAVFLVCLGGSLIWRALRSPADAVEQARPADFGKR